MARDGQRIVLAPLCREEADRSQNCDRPAQGAHPVRVNALVKYRAACRNRTDDLFITSESLCRLS